MTPRFRPARPPTLARPHHRALGRTPVARRAKGGRECPISRRVMGEPGAARASLPARSATLANAVVDLVVFLLNLAIKRRRSRGLRKAWPWHGLAGRGRVVLIQKVAWRRLAEVRGRKTFVLPVSRAACGRRKKEGGDDDRFCHDLTLAIEDAYGTEIALICLGFKRPTRSNVVETRLPFPANAARWPKQSRHRSR